MHETDFFRAVTEIRAKDPRYDAEAYAFVREALDYSVKILDRPKTESRRHVTGQELLDGIRQYALREFGPMALTVLNTWGIEATEDIGEMVFNLVESGILRKTEEDKREHFADGYDFHEAFAKPFLPASKQKRKRASRKKTGTAEKPDTDSEAK